MKFRIWGLILLLVGVMALLQGLKVYDFGLAFWPVLLVLLGLALVWSSFKHWLLSWFRLGLGLWIGAIGLFEILSNAGVTTIAAAEIMRFGWPLLLIALGLSIMFGNRTSFFRKVGRGSRLRRHSYGDLYHGREPWVLDGDLNLEHGIGDVVVDLATADIMEGAHKISVNVSVGELLIRIPDNVSVEIDAAVTVGELDVLGESRSGVGGLKILKRVEAGDAKAHLLIEARLGIGELEVTQVPALSGTVR